jgi:predicted nucleic acid-binding protein
LNEFTNVLRNKLRRDWAQIEDALQDVADLLPAPLPLTLEMHKQAVALARDHGFQLYDAMIVAAARSASCKTLYSEDMQAGRTIGSLTIVNPFA